LDDEKSFIQNLSQKLTSSNSIEELAKADSLYLKKGFLNSYFQLTREIVFENVRQYMYPQKPSRLNGIWLTDFDYKERWIQVFENFHLPYKVFLIRFTGKIHKADARWITKNATSLAFNSYHTNAIGYWNGELQSNKGKPDEEYLGNGYLEIIEEISCKL
jgi:hypothetical protein